MCHSDMWMTSAVVQGCNFTENSLSSFQVSSKGAAIYGEGTSLSIISSYFSNNQAQNAGAIYHTDQISELSMKVYDKMHRK